MKLPKCDRIDCFQNTCGGACKLLNESYKDSDQCPFFNTQEKVDEGRRKAHQKLVAEGRMDLIETYEYNPQRRGMW